MECLRCGRENDSGREFCDTCLQSMEKYPVNPNTVIQLPRPRPGDAAKKQSGKKRVQSTEEQLTHLKKLLRILITGGILLLILFGLVTALLVKEYQKNAGAQLPTGRNDFVTAEQNNP